MSKAIGSMRARMTLLFSLGIALLMVLVGGGLVWNTWREAEHRTRTTLTDTARQIRQELMEPENNIRLSQFVEDRGNALVETPTLLLVDRQGRVLEKTGNPSPPWPHRPGDGWRVVTVPWGANTVVVGLPWARTERSLRNQAILLIMLSLAILAFATWGARAVVDHTLSPIDRLCQQASAASGDDVRVRLSPPSEDAEIVRLVDTLNGLLESQWQAAAARARFYAAASHELRTPLQALSGHLELALNRQRSRDEYVRALQEAHTQTQRLVSLVRALLLLNRLDSVHHPQQEPVDLMGVLQASVELYAPLMQKRGVRLQTAVHHHVQGSPPQGAQSAPSHRRAADSGESARSWPSHGGEAQVDAQPLGEVSAHVQVLAVPTHAEMLVRNLVENAAKFTTSGGTVTIQLNVDPESVRLRITNECQRPPDWDENKPPEPFYRSDASRSAGTGGNGLGLAVCQSVARVNGWRLLLRRREGAAEAEVAFGRPVATDGAELLVDPRTENMG